MRRFLSIAFLCWLIQACSPTTPVDTNQAITTIDATISKLDSMALFSGVVLVARYDSVLYQRAAGYSDQGQTIKNTTDTRFGIGSVTKLFTGVLFTRLEEEGLFTESDPVESFVSGIPEGNNGHKITFSHLLNHRSGISHRVSTPDKNCGGLTIDDTIEKVRASELEFNPGESRLYSSAGYTTLAYAMAEAKQQSFGELTESMIFQPAGMLNSSEEGGSWILAQPAMPLHLGITNGVLSVVDAPCEQLGFLTGGGSAVSTSGDLLNFILSVQRGTFGESVTRIWWPADEQHWTGWAGRTYGYEAYVDVHPRDGLTVIILSNLRSAVNWQIREYIKRAIRGGTLPEIQLPPPPVPTFENVADLPGNYDRNGRIAEISLKDGTLFRGENQFYPISGDRYYIPASGTQMRFRRNANAEVDAMIQIRGDNEMVYIKTE